MFDEEFNHILGEYPKYPSFEGNIANTAMGLLNAATAVVAGAVQTAFSGNTPAGIAERVAAANAAEVVGKNQIKNVYKAATHNVKLNYYNTQAFTDYGEIDKQKLMLSDIMTINFDDNLRKKEVLQVNGDN
jgi:hypothetical protein